MGEVDGIDGIDSDVDIGCVINGMKLEIGERET